MLREKLASAPVSLQLLSSQALAAAGGSPWQTPTAEPLPPQTTSRVRGWQFCPQSDHGKACQPHASPNVDREPCEQDSDSAGRGKLQKLESPLEQDTWRLRIPLPQPSLHEDQASASQWHPEFAEHACQSRGPGPGQPEASAQEAVRF
mmetsp:Transcript_86440/g.152991  ORF Transcript_86440/g.152991 Transcript_86440/m.152991 type:complete len:148 (+) Transcript_86440:1482-1925(+)